MYRGTYQPNKRPVVTTAPDCLVFLQGELSLPSGANPNRRVPIQPLINSVSVNVGVNSVPGSASVEMHIPYHYLDDLYVGGQLTLTDMMEVQIYAKGHFTVGGAPRYYPLFWGVVTSLQENYSAGEQTVSLSCSDILYWWQVSQININPSFLATQQDQTQNLNLRGHTFTGMNAFDIIYSLSRYVYGDSMNVQNQSVSNRQFRTEPISGTERKRYMAYWTQKWGRITNNLKMFGPSGNVLQGSALASVLTGENRDFFLRGRKGSAKKDKIKDFEPFRQDNFDVSAISPFSQKISQLGAMEISNSEFETKLNLAMQTKEAINYEFFMDVTGEIIFKPPFYNMDTRPNFPVSWIRDVDIISESYATNPPEATFIEATGRYTQNIEIGLSDLVQTKATYVDYRLVQKYGWRPGSFSSEFIGSKENGGPKALFYHLVDVLDRQNSRINSGTLTIPFRPELRLGYPVYVEGRDTYYYVESISHNFSYGSSCTTSLTLMARRQKFYGAFERWRAEQAEPKPSDIALPGDIPRDIYARDRDSQGRPLGDRNVIMTYIPEKSFERFGEVVPTFQDDATDADKRLRNLIDLRSQFGNATDNRYVYAIDPNRDQPYEATETNNRQRGPITHIEADPRIVLSATGEDPEGNPTEVRRRVNAVVFPVSDEEGYEVIGAYEYGRRVSVTTKGYRFDQTPEDRAIELLLNLSPDAQQQDGRTSPDTDRAPGDNPASAYEADASADKTLRLDPNNYGRRLAEVAPPETVSTDPTMVARVAADRIEFKNIRGAGAGGPGYAGANPNATELSSTGRGIVRVGKRRRTFKYNSNVARWRPLIRKVREQEGIPESAIPDEVVLAFINVESDGRDNYRRSGSQYVGLFQIGKSNAGELGRENTDMFDNELAIRHFFQMMRRYRRRHEYDPRKMAIFWKNGAGSLRDYNAYESSEPKPSQADLDRWLKEYPTNVNPKKKKSWNADIYVNWFENAKAVWSSVLNPVAETETLEEDEPEVKESAKQGDQAEDPEAAEQANATGTPDFVEEDATPTRLFAQALKDNREAGNFTLPTEIIPPRDPGIISALNEFLIDLYQNSFDAGRERERNLRGENTIVEPLASAIPRTGAETPVILPEAQEDVTDESIRLNRDEIRERLDAGETLGQVLGSEIRTDDIDRRLRLQRTSAELDAALEEASGLSISAINVRLERGDVLSNLIGDPLVGLIEQATGLSEQEQTEEVFERDDLDALTGILNQIQLILESES